MNFRSLSVWWAGALVTWCMVWAGCVTSTPDRGVEYVSPDRATALKLLDDVDHAPWESWTPIEVPISSELEDWVVFDRYRLDKSPELEAVWSSVFGILSGVRNQLDSEVAHASTRALMALLEPSEDTVFDLFFAASTTGEFEGVILQARHRSEPTQLRMLIVREQGGVGPAQVKGWFVPGFREAPALKISLERVDGQWSYEMVLDREHPVRVTHPDDADLIASVVLAELWSPWVGLRYSSLEGLERPESVSGMQARKRSINEVLSDTVFAPRMGRIGPGVAR